jgi:hydrogenobyrinic acid a,c-diamide synthase (glutamine-hydrolysing) (EC 6.3.5.9)/cobyrinate a,c-diamide synthase (EC 6.3.5.-)
LALIKKTIESPAPVINNTTLSITVAVAKDSAFGFYYQDDLDAFESLGV